MKLIEAYSLSLASYLTDGAVMMGLFGYNGALRGYERLGEENNVTKELGCPWL